MLTQGSQAWHAVIFSSKGQVEVWTLRLSKFWAALMNTLHWRASHLVQMVAGRNELCWAYLVLCQTYQVVFLGMTTNERMNLGRYTHFRKRGKTELESPFSRGSWNNLVDFLGKLPYCSNQLYQLFQNPNETLKKSHGIQCFTIIFFRVFG